MCQLSIDFGAASVTQIENSQPDLSQYDRFVVFFSGGKDSVACVLALLDAGVDPERIELHHHIIDGREGSDLFDWPVTEAYCEAFAKAMGLRIFFSWKVGGFEREMLRNKQKTAPIAWETEDGRVEMSGGDGGKEGTRRRFPQVSADLRVRWCSAYGDPLMVNKCRVARGRLALH